MSVEGLLAWFGSLSEPQEATNGIATCPYARPALDDGKVAVVFKNRFIGTQDIDRLVAKWTDQFDVVLLIVARDVVTPAAADAMANSANLLATDRDLVVMVDHPDRPFVVAGHNNSNGEYVIFFIQKKSRLEAASAALRAKGYYRNWPAE